MKPVFLVLILGIVGLGSWTAVNNPETEQPDTYVTDNTLLWDVMTKLGKIKTNLPDTNKMFSAEKGMELVLNGSTTDFSGRPTAKLNKKFVCTTCHTTDPEHFSPVTIDAKTRLLYSDSMKIPFLPGAPFYGIVNRISFFNDDFQTKYKGANATQFQQAHRNGLRDAIMVCNNTFGQGRKMEDWEIESILAYFWTKELKIGDLDMDPVDLAKVDLSLKTNKDNARAVNLLRRYYNEIYPAHLSEPVAPEMRRKTSPIMNSFTNGWRVYRWSCLHCHQNRKHSKFGLDVNQKSFKLLKANFEEDSKLSMYNVIRYHPISKAGETGMPLYTSERMSDQQIQDLRFFIIQMANMGAAAFDYYRGR